jgi:predicted permease
MQETAARLAAPNRDEQAKRRQRIVYQVFLPVGILANVVLGVFVLYGLRPATWTDWLQVGTGAFCCVVAGWLSAALWSKVYWNRSMARQVAVWRQIADAFFTWVEDVPLPAEAINRLQSSLDKVVPSSEQN